MEDKFLGDATQQILGPLVRLVHSEIAELWAYYEAGFHNLLVVSVDQRYAKEAMKTALGLLGLSQLSLTKSIILVSAGVNVRNFDDVMKEVRDNFDPHYDFLLIPRVPLDTLDFTSYTMNLGSRMIIDATKKRPPRSGPQRKAPAQAPDVPALRSMDRRIVDARLVHDTMMLVKVRRGGADVIRTLVARPELAGPVDHRRRQRGRRPGQQGAVHLGRLHPVRLRTRRDLHRSALDRDRPGVQWRDGDRCDVEEGIPEAAGHDRRGAAPRG